MPVAGSPFSPSPPPPPGLDWIGHKPSPENHFLVCFSSKLVNAMSFAVYALECWAVQEQEEARIGWGWIVVEEIRL